MGLSLKILLILITILIIGGIQPFFPLVDVTKPYKFIWNLLTTAGWVYVVAIAIAAILSVIMEMKADKESTETMEKLKNIELAIKKSGLKFDSINNTIINTNTGSLIFEATGNSTISISGMQDNRKTIIETNKPIEMVILGPGLISHLETIAKEVGVTDKSVWLIAVTKTNGKDFFEEISILLTNGGYTVHDKIFVTSDDIRIQKGLVVTTYLDGRLCVVIGQN